jgi:hypothetical protein
LAVIFGAFAIDAVSLAARCVTKYQIATPITETISRPIARGTFELESIGEFLGSFLGSTAVACLGDFCGTLFFLIEIRILTAE